MRAVLLGTDLMYDKSGRLVPIEINTNIGYDSSNRVESTEEWFDLSNLVNYVKEKGFTRVVLDSSTSLRKSFSDFKALLREALRGIAKVETVEEDYEDKQDTLYIRIKFSDEAVVDFYCRDKIAFFSMISKSSKIAQELLYKEDGEIKGEIKTFFKNGEDPNYIVKFRYPQYAKNDYPKYYKLKSLKAVQKLAEKLEDGYLIMPCYLNTKTMYGGERFILLRQWSLLVPDEEKVLRAIDMGSYTKLSGKVDRSKNVWGEDGELLEGRENYLSRRWTRNVKDVLLEEGDLVLMADGAWRDIEEVNVGDEVLSIDVPHTEDIDIRKHTGDLNITAEELEKDSKYTINKVASKGDVEGFQNIVHMTFEEDGEEWWDTENSSYLVLDQSDGSVELEEIKDLVVGDKIYLVALSKDSTKVQYVERTVKELWTERKLEKGYTLALNGSHLFITKAPESTTGYVSIEHNDMDAACECARELCDEACEKETFSYLWGVAYDHSEKEEMLETCQDVGAAPCHTVNKGQVECEDDKDFCSTDCFCIGW